MGNRNKNTETVTFPPTEYNYKGSIIKIVPNEIQTSSKGVNFICKSTTKNMHVNSIWLAGTEYFHWIYRFEYFNFSKKGFSIEINHANHIVKFTEINH